jgi:hypothetical protein
MRLPLRGIARSQSHGSTAEDHVDAAALIARYFGAAEPVAEANEGSAAPLPAPAPAEVVAESDAAPVPAAVSEPAPESDVTAVGATIVVPFGTPAPDDPLAGELLALGNSLIYDLNGASRPRQWNAIVVELPFGELPVVTTRVGGSWVPWQPSRHSRATLELFRTRLQDVDPGVGYDVLVRSREMALCRWPNRAWDVRDPDAADAVEEPSGDAHARNDKKKRSGRLRRRS